MTSIGREIRALGGNFFGGVCINLPRHPAWGRIQETYGDDPYHLGEFGAALTRGVQRYVMACVKHYALNSMENARFTVDVTIDEATLHDVYLAAFPAGRRGRRGGHHGVLQLGQRRVVRAEHLPARPTVLREQWGWDGITVTDFIWGLRDAATSLNAGLDLEEPFRPATGASICGDQLEAGETSWAMVERAGRAPHRPRSCAPTPPGPTATRRPGGDGQRRARALARESPPGPMVLLKNDPMDGSPVLPLDPAVRCVRSP